MAGYADELSLKLSAKDEMSARLKDVKKELTAVEKQMVTARREFENTGAPEAAADMRRLEKEYERLHAAQRELAKSSTQVKKDLDQIRAKAGQSTSAAHKLGGAWMKASNVFKNNVVAGISAVGIALAGREALRQYGAAEKMQASLQFAYQKFPAIADVNIEAMRDLNTEIMNRTGADDDALASAEATLAMFQLTGVEITKLIPLVNDYAIKTGTDVPSSAEAIGKALMGNAKAMKSLGIDYKATGDRSKDLAFLMDALEEKVGGVGDAFGETTQGGLKIAEENFGNLQETVGQTLVPALTATLSVVRPLSEWFQKLPEPVRSTAVVVAALGTAALIATSRVASLAASAKLAGWSVSGMKSRLSGAAGVAAGAFAAGITVALGALLAYKSAQDETNAGIDKYLAGLDAAGKKLTAAGTKDLFNALTEGIDMADLNQLPDTIGVYVDAVAQGGTAYDKATESLKRYAAESDGLWGPDGERRRQTAEIMLQYMETEKYKVDEARGKWSAYTTTVAGASAVQDEAASDFERVAHYAGLAGDMVRGLARALGLLTGAAARQQALRAYRKSIRDSVEKPSKDAAYAAIDAFDAATRAFADGSQSQANFVLDNYRTMKRTIKNSGLSEAMQEQLLGPLQASRVEALKVKGVLDAIDGTRVSVDFISTIGQYRPMHKAAGGAVFGPGNGTSDSIPAMLSNGEYVIREAAARTIGYDQLDRLNKADRMPSLPAIVNAPAITISNPGGIGRDAPLIAQANFYPTGQVDLELALAREARRQDRDQRTRYAGSGRR